MTERYFDKFPTITYANNLVVNITERAVVTNDAFKNPYLFYPYDIEQGERPDLIADRYYNDQYMSWILYLGNKITDPYYDWYLTEEDFNNFLMAKYNTEVYVLQDKIQFYRNNWYENEGQISVEDYDALANTQHRYWEPVYTTSQIPDGYARVKQDWTINTNSVRQYTANNSDFSVLINNEIVDIHFDSEHSGKGQVVVANSSSVTLQHISGTSLANSTVVISGSSYLQGRESNTALAFGTAIDIADNIAIDEVIYWSPVSIYDFEREQNEQKRTINVLDTNYSMQISNQLTKLLNQ